jgi:hypothetical protein
MSMTYLLHRNEILPSRKSNRERLFKPDLLAFDDGVFLELCIVG